MDQKKKNLAQFLFELANLMQKHGAEFDIDHRSRTYYSDDIPQITVDYESVDISHEDAESIKGLADALLAEAVAT